MDNFRDYRPIEPRGGTNWKRIGQAIWAPIAAIVTLAVKFGFVFAKFAGLFLSVGAYALLWGWQFGVGFVLLILIHEFGHALEAKRQGLQVSAPTFVPFIGAYVTIRHAGLPPWRSATISLAGPVFGGAASALCWALGNAYDSRVLHALAFTGFFLNLFNLVPIGFLDGGQVVRAAEEAWRMPVIRFEGGVPMEALRPNRAVALLIVSAYVAVAALLVLGMWQTHVPQHRL